MKRWFLFFLTAGMFLGTPQLAQADVSGLVPCKDSAVFKKRLDGSVAKLKSRLANYEEGTPAYLALEEQIIFSEYEPIPVGKTVVDLEDWWKEHDKLQAEKPKVAQANWRKEFAQIKARKAKELKAKKAQ